MHALASTYRRVFAMVLELGESLLCDVLGRHGDLRVVVVLRLGSDPGPTAPRWKGFMVAGSNSGDVDQPLIEG